MPTSPTPTPTPSPSPSPTPTPTPTPTPSGYTNCDIGGCCCTAGVNCPVKVFGCGGSAFPYQGVTVNAGGTSGVTDSSGLATLVLPSSGNYLVTVTGASARFVSYSQTLFLSGTQTNIQLIAETGYTCSNHCLLPVNNNLVWTLSNGANGTGTNPGGGSWALSGGTGAILQSLDLDLSGTLYVPNTLICPGSFELIFLNYGGFGFTLTITE
jgi:hypothetical protein